MVKRILDVKASDTINMSKKEKLESLLKGEGRGVICEIFCSTPAQLGSVSNLELAVGFGADILLLNNYHIDDPVVQGMPRLEEGNTIKQIKELAGRMIGVDIYIRDSSKPESYWITEDIQLNEKTLSKLIKAGVDIINVVGDPDEGVTNEQIVEGIKNIPNELKEKVVIISGRMNKAGASKMTPSEMITKEFIKGLVNVGVDIIMLPAPGTVPGFSIERVSEIIEYCHSLGVMTLTAIGTSQEGADESTIKSIALNAKMCGTDLHHLGDSGAAGGVATPENIMSYSIAIKGKKHTYKRMASSINR